METTIQDINAPLNNAILKRELAMFTGTENHYREVMGMLSTDGVRYLAERAKCNWLVSDIAVIARMKLARHEFLAIKITAKNGKATVRYEDGNDNRLFSQRYEWTDFPDGTITLFHRDNVLMLPSEY